MDCGLTLAGLRLKLPQVVRKHQPFCVELELERHLFPRRCGDALEGDEGPGASQATTSNHKHLSVRTSQSQATTSNHNHLSVRTSQSQAISQSERTPNNSAGRRLTA